MRLEASTIADGTVLEFDLCIVGAGPAGLAIASALESAGRRTAILDGASDSRSVLRGENRGYPYHRLDTARARGPGGTSRLWFPPEAKAPWPVDGGLRCRPLDPIDFEGRPAIPHSGWPIRYEDVAMYYGRARRVCGLGETPPTVAPGEALAAFAWEAHGGFETTLCEFGPKARFDELATSVGNSDSVTVLAGASAIELRTGPSGNRVESVRAVSADGRGRFAVKAGQFVLATGGIENARLLLASRDRHADGIGNGSGHVGRWFQEHIHVDAGHLWPARGDWTEELEFFRRRDVGAWSVIGGLRPGDEVQRAEALLNTEIGLLPRAPALTRAPVRAAAELVWGIQHRSMPMKRAERVAAAAWHPGELGRAVVARAIPSRGAPGAAALVLTSEQAPNPLSRVTLSGRRDARGVALPRLEWRFTKRDQHSLRRTTELAAAALEHAGVGRVEPLITERWGFPRLYGCWHHIGTTRMSSHERDGVVDERCRVHGMENLHIAGSSVFATGGSTTVTLSLVALALRLADELKTA